MAQELVIIDYNLGNPGSILNMLKELDVKAVLSRDEKTIAKADKLILCGVGAFDNGMNNLRTAQLIPLLDEWVLTRKKPILGVCLGMQLFAQSSEEGSSSGLGWVDDQVVKFKVSSPSLKVPHMGWNEVRTVVPNCALLANLSENFPRYYFVHSYHYATCAKNHVLGLTHYGYDFPSVIQKDNIFGVQFHPEKSHRFGMNLLRNFVQLL